MKILPKAFYSLGFVLGERGKYEEQTALKLSGSVTFSSLILFVKYISIERFLLVLLLQTEHVLAHRYLLINSCQLCFADLKQVKYSWNWVVGLLFMCALKAFVTHL